MKPNTEKRRHIYPYSKKQVYLSFGIFLLSLVLALLLLQGDLYLMLYYLVSTVILTAATFLLKMRLYPFITRDPSEEEPRQDEGEKTPWKMLIIALFMLVGSVLTPMLLAGFLGGASWFILMVSFTSGVSISEIIFYLQTSGSKR